jgi:hypothetical protein
VVGLAVRHSLAGRGGWLTEHYQGSFAALLRQLRLDAGEAHR